MPQAFADTVLLDNLTLGGYDTAWTDYIETLSVDMNTGDSLVFDYTISSSITTGSGYIQINDDKYFLHVYGAKSGVITYTSSSSSTVNIDIKYAHSTGSSGSDSFTINSLTHVISDSIEEPLVCDAGFELVDDTCQVITSITEASTIEEILSKLDINTIEQLLSKIFGSYADYTDSEIISEFVKTSSSVPNVNSLTIIQSEIISGDDTILYKVSEIVISNYLSGILSTNELSLIPETNLYLYAGLFLAEDSDEVKNCILYSTCELIPEPITMLLENVILGGYDTSYTSYYKILNVDMDTGDSLVFDYTLSSRSGHNSGVILINDQIKYDETGDDSGVYTYTATSSSVVNIEISYNHFSGSGGSNSFTINSLIHTHFDDTEEPVIAPSIPDEESKKKGGGSNEWKTKPTFGLSHQTWIPLVDGGFTFNGVVYEITDNWHTDFPRQNVTLGELNTFEAKVYAQNKLMIQEFLFGIPVVGESNKAELGVEIWYDRDGVVEEIIIVQETDIVDVSTVNATHSMVKCQYTDTKENCHSTILTMKFLEPLKDDIMALKAVDFQRRTQVTFLNEGFDISGISLNPMITMMIGGIEKYEGVVEITQTAKYSDLWIAEDGREFIVNDYGSFKWINQSFERYMDTGEPKTRSHSAFAANIAQQQEIAQQTIDELYKSIESVSRDDLFDLINSNINLNDSSPELIKEMYNLNDDQLELLLTEMKQTSSSSELLLYPNDNLSELITTGKIDHLSELYINYDELSTTCTALQSDYDARILLYTNYPYMNNNNLFADTLLDTFPLIQLQTMIDTCNDKLVTLN